MCFPKQAHDVHAREQQAKECVMKCAGKVQKKEK